MKKVILVTDGDEIAKAAVERAAQNLNLRTISSSAGNRTPLQGEKIVDLVLGSAGEVVVVMCDDRGESRRGPGENAIYSLAKEPRVKIIGAVAVASHTPCRGVEVTGSITKNGEFVSGAVDKDGKVQPSQRVYGDTVDVLDELGIEPVVGLGDPGKMDCRDEAEKGAPLTTKAIRTILEASGENVAEERRNWQVTGEVKLKGREGERS